MGCSERDKSQVIFTSGLTLAGLISKLFKPVQPSRTVICVNVHVGINDCRNGCVIKKETWSNAIHALRRCFPSARVNLSSILPLNDSSGHVAYCINKSNDNMYTKVSSSLTTMRHFTLAAGTSNPPGTVMELIQTNVAVVH